MLGVRGETLVERRDLAQLVDGERQVGDRDDACATARRTGRPRRRRTRAGARGCAIRCRRPGRAAPRPRCRARPRRTARAPREHLRLQLALVGERRCARTRRRRRARRGRGRARPRPTACGRRCGLGSSTRTVSARQNVGLASSVIRATTRSPGIASATNTTRPSSRATLMPPCAMLVASSSTSRPAHVTHSVEHRRPRGRARAPLPRLDLAGPARDPARGRASSRSPIPSHVDEEAAVAARRPAHARPRWCMLLARLKAEAVAGARVRRRAPSTASSSAATRPSNSTAASTASRTCPRSPASAGTRSAGGRACCTPATG